MFHIDPRKTSPTQVTRRRSPYLNPQSRTLDPKTDVVFKLLFAAERNRHLLIKLLTAVLSPASPIAQVRVLNPEIDPSEYGDKHAVLDILAVFEDGTHVAIEMHERPREAIEERLVFYWAKTYCGQPGAGDPHTKLRPVIGIYFLDFARLPTPRPHSTFHVHEDRDGLRVTDALEMHFLELPKYAALKHPHGEIQDPHHGEPTNELADWCQFLAARTDEEQEALAVTNPDILDAKARLDELSADSKARRLAEDRFTWEWAYHQDMAGARRDGREEGLRDGREEGLRDGREEGLRDAVRTACELVGIELSADRSTSLQCASLEELESLLDALNRDRSWPE